MSGNIINKVLGFAILILLANYLGPESYGTFTYAFALVTFFIFFTDFGIPSLTIRQVVRNKEEANKYLVNSIILRLLLSVFAIIFIFILINLIEKDSEVIFLVLIISATLLFNSLNNCFEATNSAFEKMEINALLSNLKNIIVLLGILAAIFLKWGLISIGSIYLLASLIVTIINYIIVRKKIIRPHWEIDIDFWKYLLAKGWPFALTGIFFTIYFKIDTIMLKLIKGGEEVGYYNAAFNLVFALSFIPVSLTNALFPRMSEYFGTSKETLYKAFRMVVRRIVTLSLPIALGGFILANPIILLFYRESYFPSIVALQILIGTILFAWVNMAMTTLLNSVDKQIIPTKITGFGVIFNIALNIILIPKYGFKGACVSTLLTEIIITLLCYNAIRRYIPAKISWRSMSRILVALIPCGLMAYYLNSIHVLLLIILCSVIYFSILIILKEFSPQEKELLKAFFKR